MISSIAFSYWTPFRARFLRAGPIRVQVVLTFFFLGIEEIGVRTEQPFDVLPIWQYLDAIDASVGQILTHGDHRPPA